MPEDPYTNRELDAMFKVIVDKMDEHHTDNVDYLKRIETQTLKTNGRVTALEVKANGLEIKETATRTRINTGIAVIIVLVIPLIVYVFALSTQCNNGGCATTTNTTINQ